MFESPYKVLGVLEGASLEDCKKAYKSLCIKHHPDNNGDEKMFDKIQQSWLAIKNKTYVPKKPKSFVSHVSLMRFKVINSTS